MRKEMEAKAAYERSLFEMVLRHELPDDCDVKIEVGAGGGKAGKAVFEFRGATVDVKADLKGLGTTRIISGPACW